MKRRFAALVLIGLFGTGSLAAAAPAGPPRPVRRPSYGVYVKTTTPDGKITYRHAYRGYESNFPPPAFLYYGYPSSGFSHGIGF